MTRGDACPTCGRTGLEPHEVAGEGRVVVWTTIHVPPTRYAAEAPYTVVMVELDGGLRTMGDCSAAPGARWAPVSGCITSICNAAQFSRPPIRSRHRDNG